MPTVPNVNLEIDLATAICIASDLSIEALYLLLSSQFVESKEQFPFHPSFKLNPVPREAPIPILKSIEVFSKVWYQGVHSNLTDRLAVRAPG